MIAPEHKEIHEDLAQMELEDLLIWELEDGEKLGPGHYIRNTMRVCAKNLKRKFKTMQHKNRIYVVRVE